MIYLKILHFQIDLFQFKVVCVPFFFYLFLFILLLRD